MLAITMGDPNGIGPEIINKLLKTEKFSVPIVIIGNRPALEAFGVVNCEIIDPFGPLEEYNKGRATKQNGAASYAYVAQAIQLAQEKKIAGIVTAPINKAALHLAGYNFDGHTEILAEKTQTPNFGMMFAAEELNIILTTIHKQLRSVPELITKEKLTKIIGLGLRGLQSLGIMNPRLAVCGLNPHAGENGIFGHEEQEIISPVIQEYQNQGIQISGPYPADTLFTPQLRKQFDLIIAHYHDQGLIPLKMLAFDNAVNITVGLPFVRTSVDHGTAYDIVGKNCAKTTSLKQAILLAERIIKNTHG